MSRELYSIYSITIDEIDCLIVHINNLKVNNNNLHEDLTTVA